MAQISDPILVLVVFLSSLRRRKQTHLVTDENCQSKTGYGKVCLSLYILHLAENLHSAPLVWLAGFMGAKTFQGQMSASFSLEYVWMLQPRSHSSFQNTLISIRVTSCRCILVWVSADGQLHSLRFSLQINTLTLISAPAGTAFTNVRLNHQKMYVTLTCKGWKVQLCSQIWLHLTSYYSQG